MNFKLFPFCLKKNNLHIKIMKNKFYSTKIIYLYSDNQNSCPTPPLISKNIINGVEWGNKDGNKFSISKTFESFETSQKARCSKQSQSYDTLDVSLIRMQHHYVRFKAALLCKSIETNWTLELWWFSTFVQTVTSHAASVRIHFITFGASVFS